MKDLKPIVLGKNSLDEAMLRYDSIIDYIGIENDLCSKISESFFTDPASTKYHNSEKHGLLFHSINTAIISCKLIEVIRNSNKIYYFKDINDEGFEQYRKQTVFAAMFHDICKVGCYIDEEPLTQPQINKICYECSVKGLDPNDYLKDLGKTSGSVFIDSIIKNKVDELGKIKKMYSYIDDFDIGHGEKSVIMLQDLGFKLTNHQIISIRFHMMGQDDLWITKYRKTMQDYLRDIPMLRALYLADNYTGLIYE